MRSLWKGAISFGLVNIPVKLYTATARQDIRFNYLHAKCNSPIRYEKVCPQCGEEVKNEDIVKGYEYERERYVIIRDEDFENIDIEATKTVDIIDFIDLKEIDPVYFDKSYYLEPAETGVKAYQLLKKAMEETGKIGVAKVVIRTKQVLAAIRVFDNALAMETMFFPEEIRDVKNLALAEDIKIADKEMNMAKSLIENLSAPFQPQKYTNEYREAVLAMVTSKVEGKDVVEVTPKAKEGKVVDLMAALEESLQAAEKQSKNKKKQQKAKATK